MSLRRAAGALVLLAAGLLLGWLVRATADTPDADALHRDLDAARTAREQAQRDLDQAATRMRSAERELAAARRLADDERRALIRADDAAASASDSAAATAAQQSSDGAPEPTRWPAGEPADAALAATMGAIDWADAAAHTTAMLPLATRIGSALTAGTQPPSDALGAIQEHNGPLLTVAVTLQRGGVPGSGPNGAFTHPVFVANLIVASLDALGMPLDGNARARMGALADDFAGRDAARVAAYDDNTPDLRRVVDEADLKARFYDAARALLSESQHAALRPELARGRVALDLYDVGLIWSGRARPLVYRDTAHLVEQIEARLPRPDGDAARQSLRDVVTRWADALPPSITERARDALDRLGMIDAAHATACARHVAELMESVLRDVPLSGDARAALIRMPGTFVPFRAADAN